MNFLHIAGHLGADPEVRFTSSGLKVTTLRVAARARKKAGEDRTIWWKVTVWGEQFDKMIAHFKKGSPIIAVGEFEEPQIYTDRNGNPQVSMAMTASQLMFSPFGKTDQKQEGTSSYGSSQSTPQPARANSTASSLESAFDSSMGGSFGGGDGFTSGHGSDYSSVDDAFPSDEEIPF